MSAFLDALRAATDVAREGYAAPFRYDERGAIVWCGKNGQTHALDIRGLGHLFGRLRMAEENAVAVQDAFGAVVVLLLNAAPEIAALVEAVKGVIDKCPATDPCADEYDADGKRYDQFGCEAGYCVYWSDESDEISSHREDVVAYSFAKTLRTALAALDAKVTP